MLYIWLMFYVNCISIKLERIARDDLLRTLLGVGFFRVEAWEREGGGSGLLTCMSTWYCWQSIPGIAGSRWLHVTLVISAVTVTTTKVTVLSFPPSLSNENNFSQRGSYVSFWHQQQCKVTMTFPCWTSCCVSHLASWTSPTAPSQTLTSVLFHAELQEEVVSSPSNFSGEQSLSWSCPIFVQPLYTTAPSSSAVMGHL